MGVRVFRAWKGFLGSFYIESDTTDSSAPLWGYDVGEDESFLQNDGVTVEVGEPPSETLKALIAAGAPWYAVLDKFVEEYPQWEEVLAWAPKGVTE